MPDWLLIFGVPTAITGFAFWLLKKRIEKTEKKQDKREEDLASLIMNIMESNKANTVGIKAIAKAVQRIPDAKCNGDMTAALNEMERISKKQEDFLANVSIKSIVE